MRGDARLGDAELREIHERTPLLWLDDAPGLRRATLVRRRAVREPRRVGPRRADSRLPRPQEQPADRPHGSGDASLAGVLGAGPPRAGARIVLKPEVFYLLLSAEGVAIPPDYAAEMLAYDPTAGELRTHYAAFSTPASAIRRSGEVRGSRAALEVRARDVPFMVEDGQPSASSPSSGWPSGRRCSTGATSARTTGPADNAQQALPRGGRGGRAGPGVVACGP